MVVECPCLRFGLVYCGKRFADCGRSADGGPSSATASERIGTGRSCHATAVVELHRPSWGGLGQVILGIEGLSGLPRQTSRCHSAYSFTQVSSSMQCNHASHSLALSLQADPLSAQMRRKGIPPPHGSFWFVSGQGLSV